MTDMAHIIWSNIDLDPDDWDIGSGYSEEEKYVAMIDLNNDYLEDERANLNIAIPNGIIVLADIGRWNGRSTGYGRNLLYNVKDCLWSGCDYAKWYVDDDGEFRCTEHHHDGTNYLTYRKIRAGISDDAIDDLEEHLYFGVATTEELDAVTEKLGPDIAAVYGWDFKKEHSHERV